MKKYHIGYTCGVFDLFHVGHLNLLERCKEMCDILIVGVCDDRYVTEIKKKQPVCPEEQRVRILNALKVVDHAELVTVEETDDKMLALKNSNLMFYFREMTGKILRDICGLRSSLRNMVHQLSIYRIQRVLVPLISRKK